MSTWTGNEIQELLSVKAAAKIVRQNSSNKQGTCASVFVSAVFACKCVSSLRTIRTWTRLPVVEFHTFSVRLLAAVITVLSWRSHATMVTFSLVTLSSSGGGLYFLKGRCWYTDVTFGPIKFSVVYVINRNYIKEQIKHIL